jgi:biotin carboxyl carrier protein
MTSQIEVTRLSAGLYRVVANGRSDLVWVASRPGEQWAYWNGELFVVRSEEERQPRSRQVGADGHQSLTAPMPATVLKVLVTPGTAVRSGDTLMILEAMKMELPIRAAADGVVRLVACREGDLVHAGAPLVELD